MTIQDVIGRVDVIAPNQYTDEQKLQWLSDFDGKVWRELLVTHERADGTPESYEEHEDASEEMLIPAPWATDIYTYYLLSRIAEANAEIQKYNLYATMLNTVYDEYAAWVNKNRQAVYDSRGWRFG